MPGTGSHSGAGVEADYIGDIDILLGQIPDNASNLIDAKDVRDSIWTLWNRIDDVQIVASQSLTTDNTYLRATPTPATVGGAVAGTTFSGTVQDALDKVLYPYVAPAPSISASNATRQFGDSTAVTLTWSVVKKSYSITSITVDGSSVTPTGVNQNGTKATVATHSANPTATSESQSYSMTVGDGTSTPSASATVTWMNRIYWGKVDLSGIGNPNLTLSPGSAALVGSVVTDAVIKALTGAGVSPGSALATTWSKTYTNINGGGQYLVWAFPASFTGTGGATPTFIVNNLPNTAFTKVRSNFVFVNNFGFSGVNYNVWVSNTAYNSPVTIVIT